MESENTVAIKLVLINTGIWSSLPESFKAPLSNWFEKDTPFGLVHAAIQLGPYIIGNNKLDIFKYLDKYLD
jgi:hypothetical protein